MNNTNATYPHSDKPGSTTSRMGKARDVMNAVEHLITNNSKNERGQRWAQQLGMFQGNPPYPTGGKIATQAKWTANFNPMQARGMLSTACTPYYNLFESGPVMAEITLRGPNPTVARDKGRIATKHFQWLLKEADLSEPFHRVAQSFVGFGRGFWYWLDPYQWIPEVRVFYEVLFPEKCPTNHRRWEWLAIRDEYDAVTLWSMINKEGWKEKAIRQAIKNTLPARTSEDNWIEYQNQLKEGSVTTIATRSAVDVSVCLVKEWDGKWSVGIVERFPGAPRGLTPDDEPDFLYFQKGKFESITDVLVPFFYDTSTGCVNSAEGLATAIFSTTRIKDRLTNSIVDGGMLRSLTVLRPLTAGARMKAGLSIVGGAAILPEGFDAQPGSILSDINGPITVDRHLSDQLARASGVYVPSAERPIGNPDSAMGERIRAQQQTALTASGVNRFYNRLDTAWDTLYRRVLRSAKSGSGEDAKLAKKFVDYCEKEGVTAEDLGNVMSVNAYRVSGGGSQLQRQQDLFSMLQLAGAMPQRGRQRLFEDLTSATAGPDKVLSYFPTDQDQPGEGEWEANVENVQANAGSPPLFTDNQEHDPHIRTHFAALVGGLESLQQGADPATVFAFGHVMLPHVPQHIASLSRDPTQKDKAKSYQQQLGILEQQYGQLPPVIEQQRRAQQTAVQAQSIASGMDPETQLKAAKQQRTLEMKDQRQAAELAMKGTKTIQEMRMDEEKHQQELRQEAEMAQAKRDAERAKAAAAAAKPPASGK